MRKNKGLKMEPRGMSYLISLGFRPFIIDGCILSSVTEIAFEPINSYSSDAVTVSKAFCRSMKTPQAKLPLSRAFLIISVMLIRA